MNAEEWDRGHLWRFRARLVRVIDADTWVVEADTGFSGRHEVHIRIAEMNAPESSTPEGAVATAAVIRLLNTIPPSFAWPLRIVSRQRERSVAEVRSFERFVADVSVVQADGTLRDAKDLL